MPDLVDLDEAKKMLRIEGEDDNAALALLISAASASVLTYLKTAADPFVGADGNLKGEVPAQVKVATLLLVGMLRRNPDNDVERAFEPGYLPVPVMSLLYPLRTPTLA